MRNVGVLIIRIVVGIGILYYNYNKDPQNSIGNYSGPSYYPKPYSALIETLVDPFKEPQKGPYTKAPFLHTAWPHKVGC